MLPWQQRVFDERAEMIQKRHDLFDYLCAEQDIQAMSPREKWLLEAQLSAMHTYENILSVRIEGFSGPEEIQE